MGLVMAILPVVIVGGIVVYVVKRLEHKYNLGNLDLIDSLIPLGMIFGCAIGVIFGMFFKPGFLVFTVGLGAGIGYLFGVIAYEIYSKKGNKHS
ncbi:hypothetical protein [Bacillus pseudomycoides]|uniref:hypothetical protein n=1 Tax=Bacillus pseudomycoides TaxID=64104 RepID=UPI000BEBD87D|nr:hypothetical protein [Bacillus pseudomycoides]PEE44118.1 hypothetical protein COO02_04010 [Bacillus pseudomycoides]PGA90583.1 hypothetical protein COL91_13855 [Bacillus pseudomycoides]PHF35748.1 hypothetical protein COF72_25115 [Bacillus pseudomycoides]